MIFGRFPEESEMAPLVQQPIMKLDRRVYEKPPTMVSRVGVEDDKDRLKR
jgi:hypothetical protein